MAWWMEKKFRMIQNNIRDIDAEQMDADALVEKLKDMNADVLQINCGGISAFYETNLECQMRSPYLRHDFFGEVLEKCHQNGIRLIARFDFNRVHQSFLEKHPEWFCRTAEGDPVYYNDTANVCTSAPYQRECALRMIEEVLEKYPVDGIFFNAFGYSQWAYSGKTAGLCQCESCKQKFREMFGCELPKEADENDPAYKLYEKFKEIMVDSLLGEIRSLAQGINPECAVSTYTPNEIDIVRNESNSNLKRELPFWIYTSSDNVGQIEGSYENKISSNCAINAVDFPSRFMGVDPDLTAIRLYQNIASGGVPDWCINGDFVDYPDIRAFDTVKHIFGFHKKYEDYYGPILNESKIMLVTKIGRHGPVFKEYRGIFRMLKEEHIPFTIVLDCVLEQKISEFNQYEFILLPDIEELSPAVKDALAATSATVVASGSTLNADPEALKKIFGIQLGEQMTDIAGTYAKTEPKEVFLDFADKNPDWIFVCDYYWKMALEKGTRGILPKVEKAPLGPPERCFGHVVTDESMTAISKNGNIYIPFGIGTSYYSYGFSVFKRLYLDILGAVREIPRVLETDAPEMAEVFLSRCGEDVYMLQVINLSGFNGMTFFKANDLNNMHFKLKTITPKAVEEMTMDGLKEAEYEDSLKCSLTGGERYKAFLIHV